MPVKETIKVIEFNGNVSTQEIEDILNTLTNPGQGNKQYRLINIFFNGRVVCAILAKPGS